jgi:hypothetical protein
LVALGACGRTLSLTAQAPTVTVGGVGYAHYVYQLKDSANHANNFDLSRAYVNVRGSFAYGIKTRVTSDLYRAVDGSLALRLKYGFVSWTPDKSPLTFKLGMLNTPLIEWLETLWDYRMQGTVALDRAGYLSSSDLGFLVDGNWGFDKVNLSAGVINGENYNKGVGDQRKDLAGRISVRVMGTDEGGITGGLRLTAYGHYGKPTGGGTRQRYVGIASYRSKALTFSGEISRTVDSALTNPITSKKTGRVMSVFGVFHPTTSKFGVIGRFDTVDPNTNVENDRYSRVIAGVSYTMSSNLRVLVDLDQVTYQGGITTPALEAVRSQALFQLQFTF